MPSDEEAPRVETRDGSVKRRLRLGIDAFTPEEVAKQVGVSSRTVQRWITKENNPLPALHMTAAELYEMGFRKNLYPSSTGIYYVILKADLALIPVVRKYPQNTKRRKRVRQGRATGARIPDRLG